MATEFRKWECIVCGYVYDEAAGDPARAGKTSRPTGNARSAASPKPTSKWC